MSCNKGKITFPSLAHCASLSYGLPRLRQIQASISIFPGPVSKPRTGWPGIRRERLAIPPIFKIMRLSLTCASSAWWNAGTSGAPCPPSAISRRRKSPTTLTPVRAAMTLLSPICIVCGASPVGSCHTVCPWQPIATISCAASFS